ncbi:uncharacterized protein LOC122507484 [Leptopilina heterotoma]|uniref:uncharacterized protein LOC122507484 n=1 Tax=Leptopilina heterotoma TaxID=63436 RepID=UPI001CA9ECBE|nr:uncharacterized protein LOC122507484 [Leptopilina heterotoma]
MSDTYLKNGRCFPNECYICKSRENLIRCECKMISYCSEDHRQQHLSIHKNFCKVVKELLKEKGITHIYQELIYILDWPEWDTKREKIRNEIIKKLRGLGRALSPLENFIFYFPRICFDCRKTKQEDLFDCPHCPIASFCLNCKNNKTHGVYCKVINTYLKVLTTAEELNIDLKFLSSGFLFTGEKGDVIDDLIITYATEDMEITCKESKLSKIDLIDFIDVASKINNVLLKTHDTIPEELTIHIDALTYEHAITKENYWEFLLHLNPQIKQLKIVFTSTENESNLKTFLCKNCYSEGKNLNLEILSKSYDDYMLDESYQKPDILFYVKIVDECNSEKLNKWSEFSFPVVLRFESNSRFCKTLQFLSLSTAKFEFIYEGQFKTPFATLSSLENKDYFIILQSKENKVLPNYCVSVTGEICEEKRRTNTIETVLVKNIDSEIPKCENIADASKVTESEPKDKCHFISTAVTISSTESNKNKNENIQIKTKKNPSNEEEENKSTANAEQIKGQKSEDRRTHSPSSSVCSFVIISEPGEEEGEKITETSKTEENEKFSKSVDNKFLDSNEDGGKNVEGDNTQKKNIKERKEEEGEKEEDTKNLASCKSFNKDISFSQSYLLEHISYLRNEIEGLRQQLNLSFNEVTKLNTKLEKVSLDSHKKDEFIKKMLRDIVGVDFDDIKIEYTDSLGENNI